MATWKRKSIRYSSWSLASCFFTYERAMYSYISTYYSSNFEWQRWIAKYRLAPHKLHCIYVPVIWNRSRTRMLNSMAWRKSLNVQYKTHRKSSNYAKLLCSAMSSHACLTRNSIRDCLPRMNALQNMIQNHRHSRHVDTCANWRKATSFFTSR